MARWVDALLTRRLRGPSVVALLVVGAAVAWAGAELTEQRGALGPAGTFIALVLVAAAVAGSTAGLAATLVGAVLLWLVFTPPRWSLRITDARDAADVLSFVGVAIALNIALAGLARARAAAQTALGQVAAMVRSAPVGMAFVDRNLVFLDVNEALAGMIERTVPDLVGTPLLDEQSASHVREVLASGEPQLDVRLETSGAQTGRHLRVLAGYYPVFGADGAIAGVGIVVREVTAEHERDLLLSRVTRLQELTETLAEAGTTTEVAQRSVEALASALVARAATFMRLVDGRCVLESSTGHPEAFIERWRAFPLESEVPLADAIRTGEPVFCSSARELTERWPSLIGSVLRDDSLSIAALPLRGESSTFGAIGLSFDHERTFATDEIQFLMSAATACATAYERSSAFEAERDANRRLKYLLDATAVLSESLDIETTLQRLAEIAVPALADWCAVHLVHGDVAVLEAIASEDAALTDVVRDVSLRHPIKLGTPGLGSVASTGRAMVLNRVTLDAVRASTAEGELVDMLTRLRSIAIVPMKVQGKVIGTVMLSNITDRDVEPAEAQLAKDLAARASQAITNARLYTDRARVASTLQASLMPTSPPTIPGIEVATRFVPALEGLDVGGDFYDVFRLGTVDDPAPTWALVIGDVRGKGADAAAITGIARATIRAAALDERSPAKMLSRLNQVLLAAASDDRFATETGEPRFCTACVITVTPTTRGADLVVAVGGHPLPFVLRRDGSLEQVGKPGGLIGAVPTPDLVDMHAEISAGDSLVLYTDGITERHTGTMFFDEDGLTEVLLGCRDLDADQIAEQVEVSARDFAADAPKDDLAVLVAQVPVPVGGGSVDRMVLPDDETAAAIARRFLADALDARSLAHVGEAAILLASELVTNAVLHGSAPLVVDVCAIDEGVRVTVIDAHPSLPILRSVGKDDEHGRGLYLVEALSSRWGIDAHPPGKAVWFELDAEVASGS
jgi:serine phosphatase RsbU (regulator of sigma subunit)/PAS domain-containing protein/anti-sigma regulatory factor (Ser/Thr protein kinase)